MLNTVVEGVTATGGQVPTRTRPSTLRRQRRGSRRWGEYEAVIGEEQACEAVRTRFGPDWERFGGARYKAVLLPGTSIWSVGIFEASIPEDPRLDLPAAGAGILVGRDSRVWVISSNPGIHDFDLAVTLLERIYDKEAESEYSQEAFVDLVEAEMAASAEVAAEKYRAYEAKVAAARRARRWLP